MKYNNFYNNIANNYDTIRSPILDSYEEKINLLKQEGKFNKTSRILELGCGTGTYLKRLIQDIGFIGFGIDISERMISIAKNKINNAKLIIGDSCNLPIKSNYLDIVYAVNSIHQFMDITILFHEISRIIKINGKFIIITPSVNDLKEFILYSIDNRLLEFEKERLPTEKHIKNIALNNNFSLIKVIRPKKSNQYVRFEDLIKCINNRFLSCLAFFNEQDIKVLNKKIIDFSKRNKEYRVSPYKYQLLIFIRV